MDLISCLSCVRHNGTSDRQLGLTDEVLFTAVSDFSSTAGQHASERGAVLEQVCSVSKQLREMLSSDAIALCYQQFAAARIGRAVRLPQNGDGARRLR
jgi:hypothetical protein